MATVQLTSPAKGKMPGDTVTVTDGEARWLVAQGYARVDDDGDHLLDTSVEAASDPTLAANREAPGEAVGHLSNGDSDETWSEKVTKRQEFKGSRVTGAAKIVPGKPETLVAAAGKVLEEDQPEASELIENPEIVAEDSRPKGRRR